MCWCVRFEELSEGELNPWSYWVNALEERETVSITTHKWTQGFRFWTILSFLLCLLVFTKCARPDNNWWKLNSQWTHHPYTFSPFNLHQAVSILADQNTIEYSSFQSCNCWVTHFAFGMNVFNKKAVKFLHLSPRHVQNGKYNNCRTRLSTAIIRICSA